LKNKEKNFYKKNNKCFKILKLTTMKDNKYQANNLFHCMNKWKIR